MVNDIHKHASDPWTSLMSFWTTECHFWTGEMDFWTSEMAMTGKTCITPWTSERPLWTTETCFWTGEMDMNHYLFKWSFHMFKCEFLLLKNAFHLFKVLMQNMSMTITITCSNGHFTYSNVSFCCWKGHCTCLRCGVKHVLYNLLLA